MQRTPGHSGDDKELRQRADHYQQQDEDLPQMFAAENPLDHSPEASGGRFLHLSVAPDGASYTLDVPATGHRHTYQTRQTYETRKP